MKRLSFRFVRRAFLILALLFPVLYMFGSFVAGLAGSHGNVTFAQDDEVVTSSKIVDLYQYVYNGNFSNPNYWFVSGNASFTIQDNVMTLDIADSNSYVRGRNISGIAGHDYLFVVDLSQSSNTNQTIEFGGFGGYCSTSVTLSSTWNTYYFTSTLSTSFNSGVFIYNKSNTKTPILVRNYMVFDLTKSLDESISYDVFKANFPEAYYSYGSHSLVYESSSTPTYSEFVFNQILGNDNIIKQWGYYALSDDDKGFAPFRDIVSFMDDTFFHFGTSNDLALFVYGYVYYALNIVAIYELVALVVMVFTIPLKLTDRFTKEM